MAKYSIPVRFTGYIIYEVEAETEEKARLAAEAVASEEIELESLPAIRID